MIELAVMLGLLVAPPNSRAQLCVPPPTGLVSWWAADGMAQDKIGGNHGSLQNGTGFAAGIVGAAFRFDGTNDYISIPASPSLDVGTSAGFTLECWMLPDDTAAQQVIAEWNNGSGGVGVHLMHSIGALGGAGSLFVNVADVAGGGHSFATAAGVLTAGSFHHVALTYDKSSGVATIYLDGTNAASANVGIFTPQTSYPLYLGTRFSGPGSGSYHRGLLDEVSLYDRALSEAEIYAIYGAGSEGKCSSPTAPFIYSQPTNQTAVAGDHAILSVLAAGTPPLAYQWRYDGTNIDGATQNPLELLAVKISDSGPYSAVVANDYGSVTSLVAVLTVIPPPPCVPSPLGLVSWWPLEGTAEDAFNQNHGQLVNGGIFAPGKVGQALSFDGTFNYVDVAASASMDSSTNAGLTIECWIKPDELTTPRPLADWNDGVNLGAHFWISEPWFGGQGGPGDLFANLIDTGGGTHALVSPPGVLTTNSFQHVAVSYDRTTGLGILYVNASAVFTANLGNFIPQTSYPLHLGSRPAGLEQAALYSGLMDEVGLYNRGLSAAEILAIYQAGKSGKCPEPTGPFVFVQPTNQIVHAGVSATFSVVAWGTPPLNYQWNFDNTPLPDATNASLILTNLGTNQAGIYSVTVTNQQGLVTSSNAVLTVLAFPPLISVHPTNRTVAAGETAVLWVAAGGTPPFGYQWSFNETPLPEATNASLILSNVGADRAGVYSVTVTNSYGLETSSNATLRVVFVTTNLFDDFDPGIDLPQWTSFGGTVQATNHGGFVSPSNSLWFGGNGSRFAATRPINATNSWDLRFHLRFGGGGPPLWDRPELPNDGIVVESSTNGGVNWIEFGRYNTLNFTNWTFVTAVIPESAKIPSVRFRWRQLANSGSISDHWALDDVLLTEVATPPQIVTQPLAQITNAGGAVVFMVSADGSSPLLYQWRVGGADIPGATNSSLSLSNVQPSQAEDYSVQVANVAGSVISSNALLKVVVVFAFSDNQPVTSPAHFFSDPVSLQLTNAYPDGLVFYTLDGSPPSFLSSQYSGPFLVSQSVVLRAIGYRADFLEFGELGPISILLVPPYSLSVLTAGGGSVAINPPGNAHPSNTVVHLTAMPNPGWTFLQWLGDASGPNPSTNLTINRDKVVRAVFGTALTTTAAGGGGVLLNPPGGVYPYGSPVQLSAIPTTGNQFGIWGNAASGNVNPLIFTVTNANPTVSALFGPAPGGQSALTVVPVGRGEVSVTPRANSYITGSDAIITATPEAGQSFLGWSGDASGMANPLALTVDANKLVFANFTKRPRLILSGDAELIHREGVRLLLASDPGDPIEIDWSTNLNSWTQLVALTNSFGVEQVTDPGATNSTFRFYRAVLTE